MEENKEPIIIKSTEKGSDNSIIYGIFSIIISCIILFIAWDHSTEAVVFGGIIFFGGTIQIISGINTMNNVNEHTFALKISPETIYISPVLYGYQVTKLPVQTIEKVESDVSSGGSRSLDLKLKPDNNLGEKSISLSIANADPDWLEIKQCLNEIIQMTDSASEEVMAKWRNKFN